MHSYRCEPAATHTSPTTRTGHSFTRLGEEVLIFGGMVDGECSAELLSLRLPPTLAWQTLTPSGDWPSCRLGHAACAVVDAHQLWVFGGGDGRVLLNDVWTLDRLPSSHAQRDAWSCSWQCQKCAGDAASRMGHNLVYMASQKALLSFGGFVKGVKGGYSAQVLRLDLGTLTWSEPMLAATPAAEPPLRGRLGAAACVLDGETVLILGGSSYSELLDEVLIMRAPAPSNGDAAAVASLCRLPTAMASANNGGPRPRAHAAALWLPPYVVHVGGCSSEAEAALDVLHCADLAEPSSWLWMPSKPSESSAMSLPATRHKHGLVLARDAPTLGADGRSVWEAVLWGGDEKGHSAPEALEAARARCATLASLELLIEPPATASSESQRAAAARVQAVHRGRAARQRQKPQAPTSVPVVPPPYKHAIAKADEKAASASPPPPLLPPLPSSCGMPEGNPPSPSLALPPAPFSPPPLPPPLPPLQPSPPPGGVNGLGSSGDVPASISTAAAAAAASTDAAAGATTNDEAATALALRPRSSSFGRAPGRPTAPAGGQGSGRRARSSSFGRAPARPAADRSPRTQEAQLRQVLGRLGDDATATAEALAIAAEAAEMRAAAEAARAAERVMRKRQAAEMEEAARREAQERVRATKELERARKEALANEAASHAAERVARRAEAQRLAQRQIEEQEAVKVVHASLARAAKEYAREQQRQEQGLGVRRAHEQARLAWLAEVQFATRAYAEARRQLEHQQQHQGNGDGFKQLLPPRPRSTSPGSSRPRSTSPGASRQHSPQSWIEEEELIAAEEELSAALIDAGEPVGSRTEVAARIARLRAALERAQRTALPEATISLGAEALQRAVEAAAAGVAAVQAGAAAAATRVRVEAEGRAVEEARAAARAAEAARREVARLLRSAAAPGPFGRVRAEPLREALEAARRAGVSSDELSAAEMTLGALEAEAAEEAAQQAEASRQREAEAATTAERAARQAEQELRAAMRPGLFSAVQPLRLRAALLAARRAGVRADAVSAAEEALVKAEGKAPEVGAKSEGAGEGADEVASDNDVHTMSSAKASPEHQQPADRLRQARAGRAAQAERRACAARQEAATWAKAEAEVLDRERVAAETRSAGLRSALRSLESAPWESHADDEEMPPAKRAPTPTATACALATVELRGQESSELRTALHALQAERERAEAAERDLAAVREAHAVLQREAEVLQREVQRLRERAESAEQHGARSSGQETIVQQLQARLRKSDERSRQGEALIHRLRSFIAASSGANGKENPHPC